MPKVSINLLPVELRDETKKQEKRKALTKISIFALVLMVLITSGVLSYRFYQSLENSKIKSQIEQAHDEIGSLRRQEELLFVLKTRLNKITTLAASETMQTLGFNLITTLTPPGVKVASFSVDRKANISLSGETDTVFSLNQFFESLLDPKKNEGRIDSVRVESLSQAQNGRIRFDVILTLNTPRGAKK